MQKELSLYEQDMLRGKISAGVGHGAHRSQISRRNNAAGDYLERCIQGACKYYKDHDIAYIEKISEPFRTLRKYKDGTFTGRFTGHAMPDFMGIFYKTGRAVCFEAKHTDENRIHQSAVTKKQADALEMFWKHGAVVGVCVAFHDIFAFVPWDVWRDMQKRYGRKYMTQEEAEEYEVEFRDGYCMFLNRKERN